MDLKKTSKLVLSLSVKIVFWMVCIAIFAFVCTKAYGIGHQLFSPEGMAKEGQGTEVEIRIPEHASAMDVAEILEDGELIENKYIFWVQTKLYAQETLSGEKKSGDVYCEAGDYVLNTEWNAEDIITILQEGLQVEEEE